MSAAKPAKPKAERYRPSCGCGVSWSGLSRAHCTGCHLTFTGASAFDKHRFHGGCRTPEEVGMVARPDGIYGKPGDPDWHWPDRDA